jgi:hypothetical protein
MSRQLLVKIFHIELKKICETVYGVYGKIHLESYANYAEILNCE